MPRARRPSQLVPRASRTSRAQSPPTSVSALRAIVDYAPTALVVCERSGLITYANRACATLLRFSPEHSRKAQIADLLSIEDAPACQESLRVVGDAADCMFEAKLRHADPPVWCRVSVATLPEEAGHKDAVVLSFEDVTKLRGAITMLTENSERYRLAVERANDIIFNIDLSGCFTFVNPTACSLTGYAEEELVGRHFLTLLRRDAREDAERFYFAQVRDRIPSTYYEYPVMTRTGDELWLGQFVQLILDGTRIVRIQAIARDITERRSMEYALRTSEERLRAVVSSAPLILWATDDSGRLTLCGGKALAGLGLDGDTLLGRPATQLIDDPTLADHLKRAQAGEAFQVELRSGEQRFDAWFSPARATDHHVTGVIGVVADVTERQRLQTRLGEIEKTEAIGQLAAGVAHDFNNQLTAVLGYAELLEQTLEADDPRRNDVREITKAGQHAAAITEQLLAYGRRQPRRPRVVLINDVIRGIEPLLRRLVLEDIQFDLALGATDPVRADPTQIERMLLNLVLNARDAMAGAGRLLVSTSMAVVEPDQTGPMSMPPGACVQIAVADTGAGMTAKTRDRVFEPFFTTKELGKGTGLGLASVYGMIKQNGGHITVTSALKRGTTFTIFLPVAAGSVVPSVANSPDHRGSETILVVDDDPGVRTLTRESLAAQGYRVLDAPNPLEALNVVANHESSIDLLLTDVVMPVMNGRELAKKLRATKRGMRVLYTTGYRQDETLKRRIPEQRQVLHKPFLPSRLVQRVREALDDRQAPVNRRLSDTETR